VPPKLLIASPILLLESNFASIANLLLPSENNGPTLLANTPEHVSSSMEDKFVDTASLDATELDLSKVSPLRIFPVLCSLTSTNSYACLPLLSL
jgi:hypothetical protein